MLFLSFVIPEFCNRGSIFVIRRLKHFYLPFNALYIKFKRNNTGKTKVNAKTRAITAADINSVPGYLLLMITMDITHNAKYKTTVLIISRLNSFFLLIFSSWFSMVSVVSVVSVIFISMG